VKTAENTKKWQRDEGWNKAGFKNIIATEFRNCTTTHHVSIYVYEFAECPERDANRVEVEDHI